MREDSSLNINGGGGGTNLGGTEVSTLSEPSAVSEQGRRGRGFSLAQMLVEGGDIILRPSEPISGGCPAGAAGSGAMTGNN